MSLLQFQSQIEEAVENGWKLRGSTPSNSFVTTGSLTDSTKIIDDAESYIKQYNYASKVCIMPALNPGFIAVDVDTYDKCKQELVIDLIQRIYGDNYCQRIGNREKLGQFFFFWPDEDWHGESTRFSLDYLIDCEFVWAGSLNNRADAIGFYKDKDYVYKYPKIEFWKRHVEDLPVFNKSLYYGLTDIFEIKSFNNGNVGAYNPETRHGRLGKKLSTLVAQNKSPVEVYECASNDDDYLSLINDPDRGGKEMVDAEVARIVQKAAYEMSLSLLKKGRATLIKEESPEDSSDIFEMLMPKKRTYFHEHSLGHILYKSIRANQYVDNRRMAWAATISVLGWLGSFFSRYNGMAPNMSTLVIDYTASGKSSTLKVFHEISKIFPFLSGSIIEGVKTVEALLNRLETYPVVILIYDEFTQLLREEKTGIKTGVMETLSRLSTDSGGKVHHVPLKNESYGVCYDLAFSMFSSTTDSFWDEYDMERHGKQGHLRRQTIFTNEMISKYKKRKIREEYFDPKVKKILTQYLTTFISKHDLFKSHDITDMNLTRYLSKKSGKIEKIKWEQCLGPNIKVNFKSSEEVSNFFEEELPSILNITRERCVANGTKVGEQLVASVPEILMKLAQIYELFGTPLDIADTVGNLKVKIPSVITIDAINFALTVFYENTIDSTWGKIADEMREDISSDKEDAAIDDFLDELKEKNITKFTKGSKGVSNFFTNRGLKKNKILTKMIYQGKLRVKDDKDFNSRGAVLIVEE